MIEENDIRKDETDVKHEYGVCIDADDEMSISIHVQRDVCMAESYIILFNS